MTMRYAEYAPDPRLAALVRCYWVFEAAQDNGGAVHASADETIVPDGNPELVFHYGESFSEIAPDAGRGAQAIRQLPGHWLDGVADRIRAARSDRNRIAVLEHALLARLAVTGRRADAAANACIGAIRDPHAPATLCDVAGRLGLSVRQLARRFDDAVGVPPRLLASILRFRSVFDALTSEQRSPGLHAAIDAGYFDQAHMIRDFRRFAGQPPQAFYRGLAGLSAALAQPAVVVA
jgi:AraC-like DNA-binding protein